MHSALASRKGQASRTSSAEAGAAGPVQLQKGAPAGVPVLLAGTSRAAREGAPLAAEPAVEEEGTEEPTPEAQAKVQAEVKAEADAQPRAPVQEKCSECAAEDAERRAALAPADDDAGDDDAGDDDAGDDGAEIEAAEAGPRGAVQSECAASSAQPAVQLECAACAEERPVQAARAASAAPVQAACAACEGHDDEVQRSDGEGPRAGRDVHGVAQSGVSAASEPLPHFERIQAAFGHHDVSAVKTQSGGAAAQASRYIGARAYTMGDRIAFGAAPDLHLAAHEAAHTVQQKAGVQLEGGVGRPGDRYEQQADRAADAVVEGRSAEGILDQNAGAGSAGSARGTDGDAGAGSAAGGAGAPGSVQMELEVTERADLGAPLPASDADGAAAPRAAASAGAAAAGAAATPEAAAPEATEGDASAGSAEAAGGSSRSEGDRGAANASASAAQASLAGAAREAARDASHGASPDEMASAAAVSDDRAGDDSRGQAAATALESSSDEGGTSEPEAASTEASASTPLQARAAPGSERAAPPVQLLAESLPLPASTTGCGDIHHPREAPPDRDSEDPPPEPPGGSVDEQIRAREEEELAAEELPCEDIAAGAEAAQSSTAQQCSAMLSAESSRAEPSMSVPGEGSGAPDAAAPDAGGANASEAAEGGASEGGGGAAPSGEAAGSGGVSAGAEDRTADAEAARAEAVAAFDASRGEIAEAGRGATEIAGLPFAFRERPGAGPEYQQDRQAATAVLSGFLSDGAARYRDLLASGETAIPGQLGELSGEARASIESAGTASEAAISARINQARLAVIAKSADATARVASAYAATVGAIEGATADAVSEIEASFAYESPRIGEVRDDGITRIQRAYDDAEANYLRIGTDAKTYAVQRGEDFASAYDICCANHAKCSRNEKDDFWDGRLTVRRVKVAKKAARETAKGYGDELEKSARRQARQARIGLPRDRHTARCSAEAYLENMEGQKQTALSQVQSAHQSALAAAAGAFASAQLQIIRQSAAALSQLAAQERQQLKAARDTTYMQIVASEQLAFAAAGALQTGVAQAARGVREGYAAVARAIDGTEAPPAAVLSELLGAARQTMAGKLQQLDEQLGLGVGDVAGKLREHTDNALATLAALVGSNDAVTTQLQTGAVDGLEQLTAGVEGALAEQAAQHTSAMSGMALGAAQTFAGLVTALENQLTAQIQGIEGRFREAATNLQDGLDETLRGMDAKIAEKASDAAYHEPPAWKTVVKWVLIIAIVVVIAVFAGPALIGFLGGLGMSAFGAAVVGGAILGAVSGGLIQVINNWETNRTWHEGVGRAIIMGAITGAIGGGLGAWAGNAFNASQSALREFFVNVGVDVFMNVLDVGHQLLTNGFDFSKIGWTDLAIGMALSLGTNALGAHPRVRSINQRVQGAGEAAGRRLAGKPPAPGGAHAPTPHETAAEAPTAGEPRPSAEAPAARDTSDAPAARDSAEAPAPRETSEAPSPRDGAEAPAPREVPAPRDTSETPAPRDDGDAPAPPRDTGEAPRRPGDEPSARAREPAAGPDSPIGKSRSVELAGEPHNLQVQRIGERASVMICSQCGPVLDRIDTALADPHLTPEARSALLELRGRVEALDSDINAGTLRGSDADARLDGLKAELEGLSPGAMDALAPRGADAPATEPATPDAPPPDQPRSDTSPDGTPPRAETPPAETPGDAAPGSTEPAPAARPDAPAPHATTSEPGTRVEGGSGKKWDARKTPDGGDYSFDDFKADYKAANPEGGLSDAALRRYYEKDYGVNPATGRMRGITRPIPVTDAGNLPPPGSERHKAWQNYRRGGDAPPCFPAGVLVKTPDGDRPIDNLNAGDEVLAFNPETRVPEARRVMRLLRNWTRQLVVLETAHGSITATRAHPFWEPERGAWIPAADIKPGMRLQLASGSTTAVAACTIVTTEGPTYNLEVAQLHTYFVGPAGFLVHNGDDESVNTPASAARASAFASREARPAVIYQVRIKGPPPGPPLYSGKAYGTDAVGRLGAHLRDPQSAVYQYVHRADNPLGLTPAQLANPEHIKTVLTADIARQSPPGGWTDYEIAVNEQYVIDRGRKQAAAANGEYLNKIPAITDDKFILYRDMHNPC